MLNRHEDKVSSFLKTRQFLNDHHAQLSAIVPIIDVVKQTFDARLDQLLQTITAANTNITGYTTVKRTARENLQNHCVLISRALMLLASFNAMPDLLEKVNYTPSSFTKMRDTELYTTAQMLLELVAPHQTNLGMYGVTPAQVAELQTKTQDFLAVIQLPKDKIGERASYNANIDMEIRQIDETLKTQLDVAMTIIGLSNATLKSQYDSSRAIDSTNGTSNMKTATGIISAGATEKVFNLPFDPDRDVTLSNKGTVVLTFGFSLDGSTFVGTSIEVLAGEEMNLEASDLSSEGDFLLVQNNAGSSGSYEVKYDG